MLGEMSLNLSRFGFGTSRLFNVASPRIRQCVLATAHEHGITHFDTAPLYGFGVAKREMKTLLAAHPNATVAIPEADLLATDEWLAWLELRARSRQGFWNSKLPAFFVGGATARSDRAMFR
jgi:diketogulonate reductase-like aldo/keto reductase